MEPIKTESMINVSVIHLTLFGKMNAENVLMELQLVWTDQLAFAQMINCSSLLKIFANQNVKELANIG